MSYYKVTVVGGRHFSNPDSIDSPPSWNPFAGYVYYPFSPWSHVTKKDGDYVEMSDNQSYKLRLQNTCSERCHAIITIDGNNVGTWILNGYQTAEIERPANIEKKFTFFRVNSQGGYSAGLRQEGMRTNGLIQVKFVPEKSYERPTSKSVLCRNGILNQSFSSNTILSEAEGCDSLSFEEGGTGLKGQSHQVFGTSTALNLDYYKQVTISLRLVAKKANYDEITPLSDSFSFPKGNPIPPPL